MENANKLETNHELIELVERYAKFNDEAAFEVIYETYYQRIYNMALRANNNFASAEDITQETFVQFAKQAKIYDSSKSSVSTYLTIIAKGKISDFREREKNKKNIGFLINFKKLFYWGEQRLNQNIFSKEIAEKVLAAINALPQIEQEIFYLKFYHEATISSIASELNLNENTVKTHIHKMRNSLIILLGEVYFYSFE